MSHRPTDCARGMGVDEVTDGALPNLVVIGAMKCGTTALHRLLEHHPDIAMSRDKELNFFFGPAGGPGDDSVSTWHRGLAWYACQFDGRAAVRGESSPGYTSPDHPEVADRMARAIADVRLLYLIRDPITRAVSQYRHHRTDGTEPRSIAEALPDPKSQYIARSRYHERLGPFLRRFPRERILIVDQEDVRVDTHRSLERIHRFLGLEPMTKDMPRSRPGVSSRAELVPPPVRERLRDALMDDVALLRELTGQELARWSI